MRAAAFSETPLRCPYLCFLCLAISHGGMGGTVVAISVNSFSLLHVILDLLIALLHDHEIAEKVDLVAEPIAHLSCNEERHVRRLVFEQAVERHQNGPC